MHRIEVCLTPRLIDLYDVSEYCVVVIDVLRATTTIATVLANGASSVIPVAELEESARLRDQGYIAGAERGGKTAEGFHFGNSPFEYKTDIVSGKDVVLTTTNGTLALDSAKDAPCVITGAFVHQRSVVEFLKQQDRPILMYCAGWKAQVNVEDTLFAGAVIHDLKDEFTAHGDPAYMALDLYRLHKNDLMAAVKCSSHMQRLANFGIEKDIEYSVTVDVLNIVPILKGDKLVAAD